MFAQKPYDSSVRKESHVNFQALNSTVLHLWLDQGSHNHLPRIFQRRLILKAQKSCDVFLWRQYPYDSSVRKNSDVHVFRRST